MKLYGFTEEEWGALDEVKKQVVRDWAFEQAYTKYVGEYRVAGSTPHTTVGDSKLLPPNLEVASDVFYNDGKPQMFDDLFGKEFEYNGFTEKFFSNTRAALNRKAYNEAEQIVNEREKDRIVTEKDAISTKFKALGKSINTSYSGCDITPSITVGDKTFVLGNIATISYSIHRDMAPVRTLGRAYPKSYVSSSRTVAGTLIFSVFDNHVLHDVRKAVLTEVEANGQQSSPLTDQLPPFDVNIEFRNEYGARSYMRIYGLQISDEGQTHSINDIYTENVMQYVARDIDLMAEYGDSWTPQAFAMTSYGAFSSDNFAAPAYRLLRQAEATVGDLQKEIAVVNGDAYYFEQQIFNDTPFVESDRTLKYGARDASGSLAWLEVRDSAFEYRAQLVTELKTAQTEVVKISESEVLGANNNLGSVASRYHDSPYGIGRQPLR